MVNVKARPIPVDQHPIGKADHPRLPQRTRQDAALSELDRQSDLPAGPPTLHLLRNGSVHQEVSVDTPRLLIGRSEDNDISIPSRYVSWHHILLVYHGGSTILIDLNSTNGTFVNSQRVQSCVLANDDIISIDRQSMFVRYSIKYSDPSTTAHHTLDDIESADAAIEQALADIGIRLWRGETDLLPALSENVPTVLGFVDDR